MRRIPIILSLAALAAMIAIASRTPEPPPREPHEFRLIALQATPSPSPTPSPTPTAAPQPRQRAHVLAPIPAASGAPIGGSRVVSSTCYSLTSNNAAGRTPRMGDVAMNDVPMGSRWYVHDGPYAGRVLVVADRIGHSSQFDVWNPSRTWCLDTYGRRQIRISPA